MRLLIFSLFIFASLNLNAITITQVSFITGNTASKYNKFEVGIQLDQIVFSNPFDPNIIDVSAEFISPSNQISYINGFYYEPFSRTTGNNGYSVLTPINNQFPWRVRFSPQSIGQWQFRVKVIHNNGQPVFSNWMTFTVQNSGNKGFVSVNDNKRYFKHSNGETFFPIGMNIIDYLNIQYAGKLFDDTRSMINRLSQSKANTARIFMSYLHFGIEWNETGVGNYSNRMDRAFDLDELFEFASMRNVKIQLCLEMANSFDDNFILDGTDLKPWTNNPYHTLLSPNSSQSEFFTNSSCINFFKQRLRYIVARWGYSTSLLSYELFNEVDRYHVNNELNINEYWHTNNYNNVTHWHEIMLGYLKSIDNNHMRTTSTASSAVYHTGLYDLNDLDYSQDHYYCHDKNFENQKNYLATKAIELRNKPNLLGEFGDNATYSSPINSPCGIGASNFTNEFVHDLTDMHDGIWSSALSGAAGTGLYWWANHVFAQGYGGQERYFEPIHKFFENEDFNLNYKPIASPCVGLKGPYDNNNNLIDTKNCFPLSHAGDLNSPNYLDYTNHYISNSNHSKIEVFGLASKEKILGWIHHKDNYWYELPHYAWPTNTNCNLLNDNMNPPISIANNNINDITNATVTIHNISCDGLYKLEFFSTYPNVDVDGDNINDNGGVIPSFTTFLESKCGVLNFEIPTLKILDQSTYPLAPDYGFKLTKISDGWSHKIFPMQSNMYNAGDLEIENDKIFYKGLNNKLNVIFDINTTMQHQVLTDGTNQQDVLGNITFEGNNVFYQGTDFRLHHYWWGQLNGVYGWHHEWLTDWNNNSQNIAGDLSFSVSNIFYRGQDSRLHHYWWGQLNGIYGWHHEWLTDWNNTSQNVGGAIQYSNGNVFYQGIDGRLHHYWWGQLNGVNGWHHEWLTDWNNNSQNVGGDIGVSLDGNNIFYKGSDSRLHHYWWGQLNGINGWHHEWLTDWNNSNQNVTGELAVTDNGDKVFFRGVDNFIHSYYFSNSWIHVIIPCSSDYNFANMANIYLSIHQNKICFQGLFDNLIHIYEFNNGCTPHSNSLNNGALLRNLFDNNVQNEVTEEVVNKCYPNPFIDNLKIENSDFNLKDICVYNILNQLILKLNVNSNEPIVSLNTSNLKSGIYFIKAIYKDNLRVEVYKVIKQ